jgi:hypothetical protein
LKREKPEEYFGYDPRPVLSEPTTCWAGLDKTECGIHTFLKPASDKAS